jgi:hypothetical protein
MRAFLRRDSGFASRAMLAQPLTAERQKWARQMTSYHERLWMIVAD